MPGLAILALIGVLAVAHWVSTAWSNATTRIQRRETGLSTPGAETTAKEKFDQADGMGVSTDLAEKAVGFMRGPITWLVVALVVVGFLLPICWIAAILLVVIKYSLKQEGL